MMFIAIKTKDGVIKGKLSFYCRMLGVSRQGFYKYLAIKDRPWKYQDLADAMRVIHAEDECNDTYGRIRMYQALLLKNPTGIKIPSERTVYRVTPFLLPNSRYYYSLTFFASCFFRYSPGVIPQNSLKTFP